MAYWFAGKQTSLVFGIYPDMSLAVAWKKRDEAKALLPPVSTEANRSGPLVDTSSW